MNRTRRTTVVRSTVVPFLLLLACVAVPVSAQSMTSSEPAAPAEPVATAAPQTPSNPPAEADKPVSAGTCLVSTGSRIDAARNDRAIRSGKAPRCANAAGRTYTREDIDRSGHVDIDAALRSLDTSLR